MKAALELSSKKNSDGLYEIYIRIQDNLGKKKRVKANYAVAKNQFKSKNHNMQWVRNHPNAKKVNADLKLLLDEYNDVVLMTAAQKKSITPEFVIYKATKTNELPTIKEYFEIKISQMLEYNQRKGYTQVLNNWLKYTKEGKLGDLDFKQIDVQILKGFENFLYKKGLSSGTVYSNLKRLRSCFNMAIKEQIIEVGDYIFRAYTMPKVKATQKEKLTLEELKLFASQEYSDGSLIKTAQQVFMLAFNLAGVRIEDVLTLKWENVKKERIEYVMVKTGAINSFQITPQILNILNYFKSIKSDKAKLIVPIVDEKIALLKSSKSEVDNEIYKKEIGRKTALINKFLKKIGEDAVIDKKISSHIARHTFASIAIKKSNGDINFVQNALKHSNAKITQVYLASLDNDSMDSKMNDVTSI
jgi:integrase/recombinase XerD